MGGAQKQCSIFSKKFKLTFQGKLVLYADSHLTFDNYFFKGRTVYRSCCNTNTFADNLPLSVKKIPIKSEYPHKNQACHGQDLCKGICLQFMGQIYEHKNQTYTVASASAVAGSVFSVISIFSWDSVGLKLLLCELYINTCSFGLCLQTKTSVFSNQIGGIQQYCVTKNVFFKGDKRPFFTYSQSWARDNFLASR